MQAKSPRISQAQALELVADFRKLDKAGKRAFIDAVAAELKLEFGTAKALIAVSEHLAGGALPGASRTGD